MVYMLKTQKPLSWFLLALLTEQGRRYCTDFDGERYWFLASQPCCGGQNRTEPVLNQNCFIYALLFGSIPAPIEGHEFEVKICHDTLMYKELTVSDIRAMLGVSEDYTVDALLTYGSHPKTKEYPFFEEALRASGIEPVYETIQNAFFGDIKSVVTPHGRLWFDIAYGSAYASELVHVASLLGAKAVIHIGNTGGLQKYLKTGDIVVPQRADGDDSAPRMYARPSTSTSFETNPGLSEELSRNIGAPTESGPIISIQAMLAETREDVAAWEKAGYAGVDLECATIFAVANHFSVPVAAAIYVADNLANESLVTDADYTESKTHRQEAKRRIYAGAVKTLLERM